MDRQKELDRLRDVLKRTVNDQPLPAGFRLQFSSDGELSAPEALDALIVAVTENAERAVQLRQGLISAALKFSKYATFNGLGIAPNIAFWTGEINNDIFLQKRLLESAQPDIGLLSVRPLTRTFQKMADEQEKLKWEWDIRQEFFQAGGMLFEQEDNPCMGMAAAETQLRFLRQEMVMNVSRNIQTLAERAHLIIERLHLGPVTEDADSENWPDTVLSTHAMAVCALNEAEKLNKELPRLYGFGARLDMVKNPAPG